MRRKKKLPLHQKIRHHLIKHFHKHAHKILHVTHHMHHHLFHVLELIIICWVTFVWSGFADFSGLNQDLYSNSPTETAQRLLNAMQNPTTSLKNWNLISLWNMDLSIENSFAKWYCTYGAARVSPEFFPYIDPNTQQRTWWGNAVDRCKNASDTWYKIWMVPSQWALIIYGAWGKFWSYGHVGKVLHYNKTLKKIIVRDMAWVTKWTISDRREDITTANVECYIYNSKTTVPTADPVVVPTPPVVPVVVQPIEPVIPVVVIPTTPTPPVHNVSPTPVVPTPIVVVPVVKPVAPVAPIVPVVVAPVEPALPVISQTSIYKKIELTLDNLSDIAQHFITQNDFTFTLITKAPLRLGEAAILTLEIKDKKTGELFHGLLPFSFSVLSTNDSIEPDISNIDLINNWSVDIPILAQKIGTASIVIHMDGVKIGAFSVEVQ